MTTVVTKPLPHKVGNATISSGELKTVVMQFMENFLSLGGQLSTLQDAVRELQRRPAAKQQQSSDIEDIETYVGRAETAATTAAAARDAAVAAKNQAVPAATAALAQKELAQTAATEAAGSASDASGDAADAAADSATASFAAARAEAAANMAAEAAANMATFMASFAICNVDLGVDTYTQFLMSSIVPDTTKTYKVEVTFNNTSTTAHTCTVTNGTTTKQVSITSRAGATPNATTEALEVAGTGYIKIDNQAATVDVVVKVYLA